VGAQRLALNGSVPPPVGLPAELLSRDGHAAAEASAIHFSTPAALPGGGAGFGGIGAPPGSADAHQLEHVYVVKQQRWLLFLRHASKCPAVEGQCPYTPHCHVARPPLLMPL